MTAEEMRSRYLEIEILRYRQMFQLIKKTIDESRPGSMVTIGALCDAAMLPNLPEYETVGKKSARYMNLAAMEDLAALEER